ncbi:MAG: hypothetical protein C5B60_02935 [Chloroflexi bacterium]|nr:MAG: hypothetical protein C5B60_02935 [Chloroflexota bacterium]
MVTTLGDLRRQSRARGGNLYGDTPRRQGFARFDDMDLHLPHEFVGILVAQALGWDTQRIAEAFTVALKQANEQGPVLRTQVSVGDVDRAADAAGKRPESVLSPEYEQVARDPALPRDGKNAAADSSHHLDVQSILPDQLAKPNDEASSQSIAEVRQQFITLGELVLEAIGAVDRSGNEAVG